MKKIIILFLSLLIILTSAVPTFAATSCEEWISESAESDKDMVEQLKQRYNSEKIYKFYHVKDDDFFNKMSIGANFSEFISQKYDIGVFLNIDSEKTDFQEKRFETFRLHRYDNENHVIGFYNDEILYEQINLFLNDIDIGIKDGNFGNVENISFLFYDLSKNIKYSEKTENSENPENGAISLYIWFVYVQSNNGEFLVPYVMSQSSGKAFLENGKIYTVKECANIMKENISVNKSNLAETTIIPYPWQTALITVACAAAAVGLFFGGKALINYNKTRKRGSCYNF